MKNKLMILIILLVISPPIIIKAQNVDNKMRILFVGNSLTYANNLPEIISQLAKSAKQPKFDYKTVAYPNFSLEDHWNKGEVQKILAKEKWDFVIMQQGPSSLAESRKNLIEFAKKLAELIVRMEAKPALFMVWSSSDRISSFANVSANYKAAAVEANGLFFPVGEAWLAAWRLNPKLELYSSDGFHPSQAGSYLAALVIYQQLYKQSPIGLSHRFRLSFETEINLPEKTAKILQEAAAETNKRYGF